MPPPLGDVGVPMRTGRAGACLKGFQRDRGQARMGTRTEGAGSWWGALGCGRCMVWVSGCGLSGCTSPVVTALPLVRPAQRCGSHRQAHHQLPGAAPPGEPRGAVSEQRQRGRQPRRAGLTGARGRGSDGASAGQPSSLPPSCVPGSPWAGPWAAPATCCCPLRRATAGIQGARGGCGLGSASGSQAAPAWAVWA